MKTPRVRVFSLAPYYSCRWNEGTGQLAIKSDSYVKKGASLSPYMNVSGYLSFKIQSKTLPVHQIVAPELFGPKKKGYTVNHIDGDKLNNSRGNLEYVTIAENIKHAVRLGLHVAADPRRSGRYKDGRAVKSRIKEYKREWYLKNKNNAKT